ncbi:MAG TPA: conjugative transposon protein TraN [Mucilaginibacter sp.]|nr:conjugative transposon protein TraN [Mucilaginibacter sp.]
MRKISAVMITGIFLVMTTIGSFAQNVPEVKTVMIRPYHLDITDNKTTNLIFPYAIRSVDKGSKDILAQKAIGVENILQVKAASPAFAETNLTVITADGSMFTYILNYTDAPKSLSIRFDNLQPSPEPIAVFAEDATTDEIALRAQKATARERTIHHIREHEYDITLDVKGIYTNGGVLYFQLYLANNSSIDYDVQSLRFSILDKKRSKRTASQEVPLHPVYIYGNDRAILHSSEQVICVALPKFTIPDKKYLSVQMMEKDGGRHVSLKINNKKLMQAQPIY